MCGCLWRPAAHLLPQTCPVWNGVVPAVVAPAEAEALDSHGCGLLFPVMVHVDLYTCLWCATAHNLQQVYLVWAGMVHAVVDRAGAEALDSHGYWLLCPVMVHVGRHVCLWRAAACNLPKVCRSGSARLWRRRFWRERWPWWLLCAYQCNYIVNYFEAGDAGATLVGVLHFAVVLTTKTGLAVVVERFCSVRRLQLPQRVPFVQHIFSSTKIAISHSVLAI